MLDISLFDTILVVLCAVLVTALAAILWWCIAGERVKEIWRGWLALPLLWKIVLPVVFGAFVLHGSVKRGEVVGEGKGGADFSRVERVGRVEGRVVGDSGRMEGEKSTLQLQLNTTTTTPSLLQSSTVSDEDIARGYRLESVTTNLVYSYECPSNGVRHLPWYMAGGHTSFKRYVFEYPFHLGTNSLEFVTVFQDGRICRTPRDRIPLLKPHDGMFAFVRSVSDFWTLFEHARRIFTWHNVRDYENPDDIYSMQIEHFANGDFIVRMNEIEKYYRWINPDDWDGDGLANEIDAAPKTGDGDFFGVASPLPDGANPAAYYWVELCATGIAKAGTIRITCDGASDLGNHVIIVRANQVCRVPLLIGAEYTLESSSPVEIVAVSSPKVEISNTFARRNGGCRIRYPLDLWFENVGGNLCELNASVNVGAVVTNITGGCCMADISSLGFKWCCSGNCGCEGGEHEVSGVATWEGYSRWVYSWVWCCCSSGNYSDEEEAHAVNLSLSVPRVIFTNDDGTGELPDLAPLKIEFSSTQETNGVIVLTHYKDLDAVRIWADSNKTDLVLGTFVWEIKNQSSGVTNLYVEGTHVSKNHQSVNFNLTWCDELLGDEKISINRKTTVYYPIANVINSTLWDNGRLCNPSGIIVGSNACFAVEFPKLEPPAEDIKWSIVEGPAAFVGGDRGSKVYVTATEPNQVVKLRVQVGDCVSPPIEFTAFTVEPLNVKLTAWIVGNRDGTYFARGADEVTNMVSEVNRIYEQIGVSFYVDSISFTNRGDWLDLQSNDDPLKREDYQERRRLVGVAQNTGGLELYFINYISKSVVADHDMFGIVLSTNATSMVLAHELGHAFGCRDIYHAKKMNGVLIKLQDEKLCNDKAFYDWNNGSGARYYHPKKNQSNLICSLIMCGYAFPYVGDLSFGSIYGLTSHGEEGLVDVGFFRGGVRRTIKFHQ